MCDEVHEGLVARFAVAFVLTDVVVGVLAPEQVDVRGSVPVLRGQRDAWTVVRLQQGAVDEVVGIDDALGQSACHLAVVGRICYLFGVVFALLPAFAADVVDEDDAGEFAVHLIIYTVGDGTAGFAE